MILVLYKMMIIIMKKILIVHIHPDLASTVPKPPQDFLSPSIHTFIKNLFLQLQREILFVKLSHQNQDQHLTNQDYHLTQELTLSTKITNKTHIID